MHRQVPKGYDRRQRDHERERQKIRQHRTATMQNPYTGHLFRWAEMRVKTYAEELAKAEFELQKVREELHASTISSFAKGAVVGIVMAAVVMELLK